MLVYISFITLISIIYFTGTMIPLELHNILNPINLVMSNLSHWNLQHIIFNIIGLLTVFPLIKYDPLKNKIELKLLINGLVISMIASIYTVMDIRLGIAGSSGIIYYVVGYYFWIAIEHESHQTKHNNYNLIFIGFYVLSIIFEIWNVIHPFDVLNASLVHAVAFIAGLVYSAKTHQNPEIIPTRNLNIY